MNAHSQSAFSVRMEWGVHAIEHLGPAAECVVVVDVMSFSTCVSIAVDRGAWIYPYPWRDDRAESYAETRGARVASPRRHGSTGYSLSPRSMMAVPPGLKLVLPSPNGSEILFRAREIGSAVFCGSLRNRRATAAACADYASVLVVACGERWPDDALRPGLEDLIGAGGILSALASSRGSESLSPEARAAAISYESLGSGVLRACGSGVELKERGFETDVDLCLLEDVSSNACRLQGDRLVPVSV